MKVARIAALVLLISVPINAVANCVDINSASFQELRLIIHIDEDRAGQIMNLRQQRPFVSVDDLGRVRGIARARLAGIHRQGLACVR